MTLSLTMAVVMLLSAGLGLAKVKLGCSACSSPIEVLTSEISSAEVLASDNSTGRSLGLRLLCQHNFENNR